MNNEPVAWMNPKTLECGYGGEIDWEDTGCIPLYTHPAKEQYKFGVDWSKDGNAVTVLKIYEGGVAEVVFTDYQEVTHPAKTLTPLTEDECEAIINKHDWFSKSWREMAKEIHDAILRKAQEK